MKKDKLHTINSGFKTPKNYFNNFDDNLINNIKLKAQVENTGFITPNDYFNKLEHEIINKVSASKKQTKVINLFTKKQLVYISAIAATIVLLFTLNIKTTETTDLDYKTVENYIIEEDISSYEIAALLDETDLSETHFIEYNTIEEDAVEDYILNNLNVEDLY